MNSAHGWDLAERGARLLWLRRVFVKLPQHFRVKRGTGEKLEGAEECGAGTNGKRMRAECPGSRRDGASGRRRGRSAELSQLQ